MELWELKSQKEANTNKLNSEKEKLKGYSEMAAKLDDLYEKLQVKKHDMKSQKNDMDSFSDETYSFWEGDTFNNRYQNELKEELINTMYTNIITTIDNNLDAINTERTRYQNLCLESEGIIGKLAASINSLVTKIENWIN